MDKKILIIEDEPDQVAMIKIRLESKGYEVISALGGEEGLDKAYSEKPDLIILDIIMPELDGYGVCNILKQDPRTTNIPIIILTATGAPDAEEICRASGADDFMKKPYDSNELLAKIKTVCAKKGA